MYPLFCFFCCRSLKRGVALGVSRELGNGLFTLAARTYILGGKKQGRFKLNDVVWALG